MRRVVATVATDFVAGQQGLRRLARREASAATGASGRPFHLEVVTAGPVEMRSRTFWKYRHGKFRDSDLLRLVFEGVVARCIEEGLVGGKGFAVDYLIDTDNAVILDVEPTRSIRQAEVGAARTTLDRVQALFGLKPTWLTADTAYGSGDNLDWVVRKFERRISIPSSPSSTSLREPMAPGRDRTSTGTRRTTATSAPRVTNSSSIGATTRTRTGES